jgi:hypothetical protein
MGRKYIKQRTSSNFVYPNNSLEEYDVEIVHDINNNSVSGTTTAISGSSISSSGITFSFNYTWAQNNAELFSLGTSTPTCPAYNVNNYSFSPIPPEPPGGMVLIQWTGCTNNVEFTELQPMNASGTLNIPSAKSTPICIPINPVYPPYNSWCSGVTISQVTQEYGILSVHMIEPNTVYYKPWRLVHTVTSTSGTTKSGTVTFTVTPSQMGVSSFSNGVYSFEIRMIGKRAIYPICKSVTISTIPVPSPTPTRTPTLTPTPTTTPGLPAPSITPTATPSATPNQISTIYKSGATINVTDTGWIKYDTSTATDVYQFINTLGVVTLTACIDCDSIFPGVPFADIANYSIIQCGTGCSGVPTPSPTPTSSPAVSYGHYQMTDCQTDNQQRFTQSVLYGTFNSGDRVEGSQGYFYVITGFTPSTPDPSLIFYVTSTGEYDCP